MIELNDLVEVISPPNDGVSLFQNILVGRILADRGRKLGIGNANYWLTARYWQHPAPTRRQEHSNPSGDVISAVGVCRNLAVKLAANAEVTPHRQASGTKM
jgi:hypothetical protein